MESYLKRKQGKYIEKPFPLEVSDQREEDKLVLGVIYPLRTKENERHE